MYRVHIMYGIWTHPNTGNRYAVELEKDHIVSAYGPLSEREGHTAVNIEILLSKKERAPWGPQVLSENAEWIENHAKWRKNFRALEELEL